MDRVRIPVLGHITGLFRDRWAYLPKFIALAEENPADETARGSLETDIADQIRQEKDVVTIDVDVDTLDNQVASGLPEPDFVKLDVEGLELDVLQGMTSVMKRRHPRLYIEIHGADVERKLANVTAVASFLWQHGYTVLHVESGTTLEGTDQLPVAIRGHLYCS